MGNSILKIALIGNTDNKFCENLIDIHDNKLNFVYDSKEDFNGLIILTDKLNNDHKLLVNKSDKLKIPIIGIKDGFDGLNLFFGGNESKETTDSVSQLFLSPGAKLSHIIGGSGWVKGDFKLQKNISNKDLSDHFFSSIISESGQILGYEKPGNDWQFGLRFDIFSYGMPKGFDSIIKVFLDKCSE